MPLVGLIQLLLDELAYLRLGHAYEIMAYLLGHEQQCSGHGAMNNQKRDFTYDIAISTCFIYDVTMETLVELAQKHSAILVRAS